MVFSAILALGLHGVPIEPTIPVEPRYQQVCLAVYEAARGRVRQGYTWDSFELTPLRQSAERQGAGVISIYDERMVAPPPFGFDPADKFNWGYFPPIREVEREPWSDALRANPVLLRSNAEAVLRAAAYDLEVRCVRPIQENQFNREIRMSLDFVKYGVPTLGGSGQADVTLDYETAQVREIIVSPPLAYPPSPPSRNFSPEAARARLAALCVAHGLNSFEESLHLELRLVEARPLPRAQLNRFRADQLAAAARREGTYAYDVGFVGSAGPDFKAGYLRVDPTTGETLQFGAEPYGRLGRPAVRPLPRSRGAYALYAGPKFAAVPRGSLRLVGSDENHKGSLVILRRGSVYATATYDRKAKRLALAGKLYRPNAPLVAALDRVTK